MKRTHFYLLATAIGLLILLSVFALYKNDTTNGPVASTIIPAAEPLSTTTANGDTFITDQSIPIVERCTPVTRACLEVQPEWGPTMATTGIERVEPGELIYI
jgi:hypothetical protein